MGRTTLPQGAELLGTGGVRYRVWAPQSQRVFVSIETPDAEPRQLKLEREVTGYHHVIDPKGSAGDQYKFVLQDGKAYPDPASRWQPNGVHGCSMVMDPNEFRWTDQEWVRPPFRDLTFYELHMGTFTVEGTFMAAIERFEHLAKLGVRAIEVMPIADFPGDRNWGYDGVLLYAPARTYGHPDDFKAFVDAAHATGLSVVLDVVYNHFGPDGNYAGAYSQAFFNDRHKTPWGDAINFDGRDSGPVRAFYLGNLVYWMEEFHVDGFRLDATHAIMDDSEQHILQEMTELVQSRGCYVIAEDERNEASMISPRANDGFGFNAVWADDFHHTIVVGLADDDRYNDDFEGSHAELVDTLMHGWGYRGKISKVHARPRGTECGYMPPERFIFCISNHDQIGNRGLGERLNHLTSAEAYRAASALLCLSPYTPLLFMGQEWAPSTPFLYFTDHNEELGRLVTEGRRKEFARSAMFSEPHLAKTIPDPQAPSTFERSKLRWEEIEEPEHAGVLELYRELLALRNSTAEFRPADRCTWEAAQLEAGCVGIKFAGPANEWLMIVDLEGASSVAIDTEPFCAPDPERKWKVALATNDVRFGGSGAGEFDVKSQTLRFTAPELILFRRATRAS
jgi:maltooligosyltrehalose trehalohydrolase